MEYLWNIPIYIIYTYIYLLSELSEALLENMSSPNSEANRKTKATGANQRPSPPPPGLRPWGGRNHCAGHARPKNHPH